MLNLWNDMRGIQYFCPFAFKARSTTLIFIECNTFHQTSLLDDVQKVLAIFTGHKLCFWYIFEYTTHILKYSRSGLTLTLKWPAWKSFLWLRKWTHRVQAIVSIWYVAARILCLVVDSQVKIWPCTLSYKNCHLTLLCLQHHFDTILTIFAKFKYYFDFDNWQ